MGGLLGAVPAEATTTLSVSSPVVAGNGPGDLIRVTGTGFTPGLRVRVALRSSSASLPMTTVVAAADGTVTLPATTRVPLRTALDDLRVTMTGVDGISAMSPEFWLSGPQFGADSSVMNAGDPAMPFYVQGLANGPDTVRTMTIDGVAVEGVQWYSDTRAFASPGIRVPVPASLAPGEHTFTLTQTGPTPFVATTTSTVLEPAPWVSLNVGPHDTLVAYAESIGYDDVWDVTIVGARGDRHVSGPYTVDPAVSHTYAQMRIPLTGTSTGPATLTVTSRRNGATGSVAFRVDGTTIQAPDGLAPNEVLATDDLRSQLKLQIDGNLVLYRDRKIVWTSGTPHNSYLPLEIRADGNVALVNGWTDTVWSTGTGGIGAGARFGIDSYGDAAVFTASGREVWSSFAVGPRTLASLTANRGLIRGQSVGAATRYGGRLAFTMQPDGNLVVYENGFAVWSTRTQGNPNSYLTLGADGNLVLRALNGVTLWSNNVHVAGARLVAQSDGNIVEYSPAGKALWATGTRG